MIAFMFLANERVVMILVDSLFNLAGVVKWSVSLSMTSCVCLQVQLMAVDLFKDQLFLLLRRATSNDQLLQLVGLRS